MSKEEQEGLKKAESVLTSKNNQEKEANCDCGCHCSDPSNCDHWSFFEGGGCSCPNCSKAKK